MATQPTRFTGPQTPEALAQERQKFFGGVMNFGTGVVIAIVVLLALMGIFLT